MASAHPYTLSTRKSFLALYNQLFPTQAPRSEFRQLTSRAEQVFRIRHIKVQTPQPACNNRVMDESGMMTRVKKLFRIRRTNVSAMSWRKGTYRGNEREELIKVHFFELHMKTIWSVIYTLILLRVAPSLSSPDPLALHSSSPAG